MGRERKSGRTSMLWFAVIIVAYALLNYLILPKLGVPT